MPHGKPFWGSLPPSAWLMRPSVLWLLPEPTTPSSVHAATFPLWRNPWSLPLNRLCGPISPPAQHPSSFTSSGKCHCHLHTRQEPSACPTTPRMPLAQPVCLPSSPPLPLDHDFCRSTNSLFVFISPAISTAPGTH